MAIFYQPKTKVNPLVYCYGKNLRRAHNTAPLLVLTHLGQRLREMYLSHENFGRAPPGLSPNRGKFKPPQHTWAPKVQPKVIYMHRTRVTSTFRGWGKVQSTKLQ